MRGLLYLLLLANVAFFGWARWIDVPPAAQGTANAAGTAGAATLPMLALADAGAAPGNASPGPANVAGAAAGAASAPVPSGARSGQDAPARCRSLGPFAGAAAAAAAAGALRERGLAPHERRIGISAGGHTQSVYWVDVELQPGQSDPPLPPPTGAAHAAAPAFSDCPARGPGG